MNMQRRNRLLISSSIAILGCTAPVFAQAATTQAASPAPTPPAAQTTAPSTGEPGIADIVVTARRRAEALQRVPITITALNTEQLERSTLRSTEDLRNVVPGINIGGQRRDNAQFFIRGQGPGLTTTGQRNFTSVATYFAEVPTAVAGPGVFYDLGSVQVLKGPQGTLFGRNTTGGAVLFEPTRPTHHNEGYAQVTIGNYGYKQWDGVVNVEPVPDVLALRVASEVSRRDGYTTSVLTGQKLDGRRYDAIRGSVLFTPGSGIENLTIADYRYKDNSGGSAVIRALDPATAFGSVAIPNLGPLNALLGLPAGAAIPLRLGGTVSVGCLSASLPGCPTGSFGGALAGFQAAYNGGNFANPAAGGFYLIAPTSTVNTVLANQAALGPRQTQIPDILRSKQLDWGVTNKTNIELGDNITLRNIIAYRVSRLNESANYSGTPLSFLNNTFVSDQPYGTGTTQFTEEFQIQGKLPSENLTYIVGVYHESEKPGFLQEVPGFTLGAFSTRRFSNADTSDAVFGHLEWNPIKLIGISGGVRQTWDDRKSSLSIYNAAGACSQANVSAPGTFICPLSLAGKFKALTYDATVNIQPFDQTLFYGKYAHGYKSGGFNVPAPPGLETFGPEYVDSFELGVKSDFNIGFPVRINAAVFHDSYNNIQVQSPFLIFVNGATVTGSFVPNGIKAINKGFEASATVNPVRALSLSGFFSYLSAAPTVSYGSLTSPTCSGNSCSIIAGRQFAYQPKWKYGVSGVFTLPIASDYGTASISADYSWQSAANDSFTPGLVPTYPAYGLVNGRIEWNNVMEKGVDLAVFGTNLTNKTYILGGYPIPSLGFDSVFYGEPRMYGMSIKVHFGQR